MDPQLAGIRKIVSKRSGKVFDVRDWGTQAGAYIQQWAWLDPPLTPPGHNNNQRWAIVPAE